MPTVPRALANGMERVFGRRATVAAVQRLSPGLSQVTFNVSGLAGRPVTPGQEIEVRIGERELRHYTPMASDAATGRLTVVFALLADGPGTRWAASLDRGYEVGLFGPAGRLRLATARTHLFLGDASTLSLFTALSSALPREARAFGAVEVLEADAAAARTLLPALDVLRASPEPGHALRSWLHDLLATRSSGPPVADVAYLSGHAQTMVELRALLRERGGMRRRQLHLKPHWATGRRGL